MDCLSSMKTNKGMSETLIFYIILLVLALIIVIAYLIFVGPSSLVTPVANFFSALSKGIFGPGAGV